MYLAPLNDFFWSYWPVVIPLAGLALSWLIIGIGVWRGDIS
jgi:hypothetical protein